MKIPSAILATAAFLVASVSAQQDSLDVNPEQQQDSVVPTLADPVGFISVGKGRLLPLTSSEFEGIERGEWPESQPSEPIPESDEQFKASGLSDSEIQSVLDTHNNYRALHGAAPLTWNPDAADFGQNHLEPCRFEHSRGKYGENLAGGQKDFPTAIKAWYDEVKMYNFNKPRFSGLTGHFTQVVWKNTQSVGCAKKACTRWTYYICNYDPPGNIITSDGSYFRNNVTPRQ